MQISWVRDGILVVGMDSEMHVYSQWKPDNCKLCVYCVCNVYHFHGKHSNHIYIVFLMSLGTVDCVT